MLLIQQIQTALTEVQGYVRKLCKDIANIWVSVKAQKEAICNHADAIKKIQSDMQSLKTAVEEIVTPDPVSVNPVLLSSTVMPENASSATVLLPLNVRVVSILAKNTSVTPTEEVGINNYSVTTDATNTIVAVEFAGVTNNDTFNLEINYINITL